MQVLLCRKERASLDSLPESQSDAKKSVARHSFTTNPPDQRSRSLHDPQSLRVGHFSNTSLLGCFAREYDLAALPHRPILRSNPKLLGLNFKPVHRPAYSRLPTPVTNRNSDFTRPFARPFRESVQGSRIPVLSPKSAKGNSTAIVNHVHNDQLKRKSVSFSSHVQVLTFRKVENERSGVLNDMPKAWISTGWTHWRKPSPSRIGRRSMSNNVQTNHYTDSNVQRYNGAVRAPSCFQAIQDSLTNDKQPSIVLGSTTPQDGYEQQGDSLQKCADIKQYWSAATESMEQAVVVGRAMQQNDNVTYVGRSSLRNSRRNSSEKKVPSDGDDIESGHRSNGIPHNDATVKSGSTLATILMSWTNVETIEKACPKTFSFLLEFILFYIAVTIW
ncbi:hypothetical protein V1509DRAFT_617528 [Lipomyces kononenkoae]